MRAFGEVLAHYRRQHGERLSKAGLRPLSDRAVARRVGVTHPILKKWEHGETRNPDLVALQKIAALYGLSFVRIIELVLANRNDSRLQLPAALEIVKRDGQEEIPPPPLDLQTGIDRRTQRQIRKTIQRLVALTDRAFNEPTPTADPRQAERHARSTGVRKRAAS